MEKIVMIVLLGLSHVPSSITSWDGCGGRLERALDAMQKDPTRRNRHEEDDHTMVYQRRLTSAPLEMTVARVEVKVPQGPSTTRDGSWARVERCHFEPGNNSLRSRVMLNDLSVSGLVSLTPNERRLSPVGESCRMTLRIRRAGIEFNTSPIARTRGQMRIRTESSFLEPRFASIFAYGCRPTNRIDRQIKRHDKPVPTAGATPLYEEAEPRHEEPERSAKEEDILIANDSSTSTFNYARFDLSPTKKTFWVTKLPEGKRKKRSNVSTDENNYVDHLGGHRYFQHFLDDPEPYGMIDWQSKDSIAREMEDVFLRGASEALTKYIERELHPAIKETLMMSMGYTISYG